MPTPNVLPANNQGGPPAPGTEGQPTLPAPPVQPPTPPVPASGEPTYAELLTQARAEQDRQRTELDEMRTERDGTKQLLEKIAELFKPSNPADPNALNATISERDAALAAQTKQLKERDIELAVVRLAGDRAGSLLDSRRFMDDAFKLDPTAADFTTRLQELVTRAVPSLPEGGEKKDKPTNTGGADLTGGNSNELTQLTEDDLTKMQPEKILEAKAQGRLNNLLGVKP